MKKLLFLALVLIIGCSNIKEEGYYKSDDRDRVYIFSFKDESKQDILEHAHDRMWTGGRFTSAYYYKQGDDATKIGEEMTGNLFYKDLGLLMANGTINKSKSKIQYAYKRTLSGYQFIDCREKPNDFLCNYLINFEE
jgi:hypothetical protein|tara:strand:- start:133 stop:543 length:411 start_codon:yes stop_codon:yes gene_type:complete